MSLGSRIKPYDIRPVTVEGQYLSENVMDDFVNRTLQNMERANIRNFEKTHNVNLEYLGSLSSELNAYDDLWIAGGAVLSGFDGHHSDIDIFFKDLESFKQTMKDLESWGYFFTEEDKRLIKEQPDSVKFVQAKPTEKVWENEYIDENDPHIKKPIQLIKMMWYTSPEATLKMFDITVSKLAIHNNLVIFPKFALDDIKNKRLAVNTRFIGGGITKRLKKYYDRGYRFGDPDLDDFLGGNISAPNPQPQYEAPKIMDSGRADWSNPKYRYDYYNLDAKDFKRKWETP